MMAFYLLGCAAAGAAGGWAVDAWIRRVATGEARRLGPVGAAATPRTAAASQAVAAPQAVPAGTPPAPLDRHLAGGRGRRCVVPALSALGCLLVGIRFGPAPAAVPFLYLAPLLASLAVVDLHTHRLPDALTLPSYPIGLLLIGGTALARGEPSALLSALVAAALLSGVFLVLALLRPAGMGMGDVKAVGVIGLFVGSLGVGAALVAAFVGSLLALVAGAVLVATGRSARRAPTPFGPWLALGALTPVLAGPALVTAALQAVS